MLGVESTTKYIVRCPVGRHWVFDTAAEASRFLEDKPVEGKGAYTVWVRVNVTGGLTET